MSALTVDHSELPDVHELRTSEESKETVGEPQLRNNEIDRDPSSSNEISEAEWYGLFFTGEGTVKSELKFVFCKYQEDDDGSTLVRNVVIGEEDGEEGESANAQDDIDPYKDYDVFLYDHDYTGMFRPDHIPKLIEEGYDSNSFPIMAGLSSHYADEEFDEQQSSMSRNMFYNGEGTSSVYRLREFQSRQTDGSVERGHGIHPTTSYRLGASPVVYSGKTIMRYSALGASQAFRTPVRESFVASPSSPRPINSYGSKHRISFSGGGTAVAHRKAVRSRFAERGYEQPGLRVMPSPTKQYTSEPSSVYQSNTASFVADPMRAANDNAPAPFIVPARGSRPSLRGKGQASRTQQAKMKTQETEDKPTHTVILNFRDLPLFTCSLFFCCLRSV
ncbi:unnamed protein product [Enterobius vermicularis]|uniref:Expressed conserved protein n=1 Tax=Enterobius vermicularis TaxID=51028 RepID=A0A0N4VQ04_ENTVE|nr:unnamed protein product [Enterobius vermicularis]